MISNGSIVTWIHTSTQRYVVVDRKDGRWRIIGQDENGAYTTRIAGEGDLTEITPAPAYSPGAAVPFEGVTLTVLADEGDKVHVAVPAAQFLTEGGEYLSVPPSEMHLFKSDLVLDTL